MDGSGYEEFDPSAASLISDGGDLGFDPAAGSMISNGDLTDLL